MWKHWSFINLNCAVSFSVKSDSLWPHELQHTRLLCPSTSPGACSNSCPSSRWCHPIISSSVIPSPPAFNHSLHQGLSLELTLCIRWPKYWNFSFRISPSTEKTIALTIWTFVSKAMSLLFNTLSRFIIAFLSGSKHLKFHGCNHHLQWFLIPKK